MSEKKEMEEKEANIEYLTNKSTQNFKDIKLDENLTSIQKVDVKDILSEFQRTLTDMSGRTDVLEHDIRLTDPKPFKVHQYPTLFRAEEAIEKEIETMLEHTHKGKSINNNLLCLTLKNARALKPLFRLEENETSRIVMEEQWEKTQTVLILLKAVLFLFGRH